MANRLNRGTYTGYDGVHAALRTNKQQKFENWFDPITRPNQGFKTESILAAKELRAKTDKEIVVLYSGGMDSEWVLESFHAAGIRVTPLIVRYADNLNEHDLYWANLYVKKRNLSPIYHDINLKTWYSSKQQREIAERVQTPELAYTTQYVSILDNDNGNRIFITGYDEPLIVANDSNKNREWMLTYSERHYSVTKFFEQFDIGGVPTWSRFSPELFNSFTKSAIFQLLVSNLYNPLVWNSELVKIQLYQHSFGLPNRTKYTGFENALSITSKPTLEWMKEKFEQNGYHWSSEWQENIKTIWTAVGTI